MRRTSQEGVRRVEIDLIPASAATEAVLLLCAFVLSGVIGLERDIRHKSAGTRTHILVGLGSALFTLVSGYGFAHLLGGDVVLDPSRIAAQIVTGIGFLGAGVIFVRQNIVSGLTTAASIWVTAAVGMACGAGMPLIAAFAVGLYLLAVTLLTYLVRRIPSRSRRLHYAVRYTDGRGALRDILAAASDLGYESALTRTTRTTRKARGSEDEVEGNAEVEAEMRFTRLQRTADDELHRALSEIPSVREVRAIHEDHD